MIKLEINAAVSGIALIASGHANEMKFTGVLVNLDTPSTKPPNGSQGKRIMIPMATAKAALHTLINMGLNYTDKLDGHNPRKKVGVIKRAWIEGKDIRVSGVIWKKDFPETEKDLKGKRKELGMSFEATDITVENQDAPVWKITSMCFTGASILYKKDAAYHATEALAAAKLKKAASQITKIQGGISMAHKSKVAAKKSSKKVSANANGGDNIGEVLVGLTDALKLQTKALNTMTASNHSLRSEMHELSARSIEVDLESEEIEAAAEESEEASSEEGDIHAGFPDKKKKKDESEESSSEEDEESMSADADDKGDLEEMESDEPDSDDKPGSLNKNSKQKGKQTQVEDKVGKEVNDPILGASLRKLMRTVKELKAAREHDQKKIKKLERKVSEQSTQITAAANKTERRSISALGRTMLIKGGTDPESIQASGKKMTVDEVDAIFASSGANLDPTQRMALKNEYARGGYMEEGIVQRTPVN